jgi:hypothetical protein
MLGRAPWARILEEFELLFGARQAAKDKRMRLVARLAAGGS